MVQPSPSITDGIVSNLALENCVFFNLKCSKKLFKFNNLPTATQA